MLARTHGNLKREAARPLWPLYDSDHRFLLLFRSCVWCAFLIGGVAGLSGFTFNLLDTREQIGDCALQLDASILVVNASGQTLQS